MLGKTEGPIFFALSISKSFVLLPLATPSAIFKCSSNIYLVGLCIASSISF